MDFKAWMTRLDRDYESREWELTRTRSERILGTSNGSILGAIVFIIIVAKIFEYMLIYF